MFRPYDIILKTRRGKELTPAEIDYLIQGFVRGEVHDYQMSAWAMAVCFQGMSGPEVAALTASMVNSGEVVDLNGLPGMPVDKHSTGGVGDKTTLVLIPLVASCGLPVAKMSGRGLGHTGGTLDKLESIPGLRVEMDRSALLEQVDEIGLAVAGQTANLVPADKKLYALRDVTATVDSTPLIASSIMSKKIAGGARAIVLDVKVGRGAFMANPEDARELARTMVEIGQRAGRDTRAVLSSMDQPLGRAIGNSLEVREAISTLKGHGPDDLRELCLTLGSIICHLGGIAGTVEEGIEMCRQNLDNGKALAKMAALIRAQGGNAAVCENDSILPEAPVQYQLTVDRVGWVETIDALAVGTAAVGLGAGRVKKGDPIDHRTGVMLYAKVGDRLESGEPWATVHAATQDAAEEAAAALKEALALSDVRADKPQLILGTVSPEEEVEA